MRATHPPSPTRLRRARPRLLRLSSRPTQSLRLTRLYRPQPIPTLPSRSVPLRKPQTSVVVPCSRRPRYRLIRITSHRDRCRRSIHDFRSIARTLLCQCNHRRLRHIRRRPPLCSLLPRLLCLSVALTLCLTCCLFHPTPARPPGRHPPHSRPPSVGVASLYRLSPFRARRPRLSSSLPHPLRAPLGCHPRRRLS